MFLLKNHSTTVDGSEIRRSPVEGTIVEIPLFIGFQHHPRWLFGISAINNSIEFTDKYRYAVYTWNLFVLYFWDSTLQGRRPFTVNRRVIWVPGINRFIWVFPKINGTPKWMVKIMENPIKMDDMGGFPIFWFNTHRSIIRLPTLPGDQLIFCDLETFF